MSTKENKKDADQLIGQISGLVSCVTGIFWSRSRHDHEKKIFLITLTVTSFSFNHDHDHSKSRKANYIH